MVEQQLIEHHIQKYILSTLMHVKFARFRDMRPPQSDSNLYSYHLKLLIKKGFVEKSDSGYSLGIRGMTYVDRINADTVRPSIQPKIITMSVIQNGYGGVLMYKKLRQPFIDQWTLPFGKVHNADETLDEAARREVVEKVGDYNIQLRHVGDCYVRVKSDNEVKISTLVHVFYGTTDDEISNEYLQWIQPHKIAQLDAAPAIKDIISRTYFQDPYFFEEFTETW